MLLSRYETLFKILAQSELEAWAGPLLEKVSQRLESSSDGHMPRWRTSLEALPAATPSRVELDASAIRIGSPSDLEESARDSLIESLQQFKPWRKGPFDFFGLFVDTEWRSDMKWDRLASEIAPLRDRLVLDIGCGNGYYLWRMAGAGARLALGCDPFLLYTMQHLAARAYLPNVAAYVLPLGLEELPPAIPAFDTVFSMGVLYHRRSPLDHLIELRSFLRPGGELVLETLVVDGPRGHSLVPEGRYAKMKNVWFIPTAETLAQWLIRCGYRSARLVDLSWTTSEEQRRTDWMTFESLAAFLDPRDPKRTIEGYPAPQRALFIAQA